ncbi:COX15/CtaA family protein [Hymenobacter bucti]|uniref:Heme A synthase n=1 Tax=Hymenobacter bucti TaxID=1844114 RepID=A0ABW4QPS2_9BACT
MQVDGSVRRFRFWSVLTVISIYLLILVGGVVRATGSGMGCPDWPRCFGQWIPPTDVSELPADYKQVYTTQRVAKNQKLARTLAGLGFKQVAGEIFAHPTQHIETDFNATKTWIEYVNRLLGALIGIFVFVTALVALPYWRRDKTIVWLAIGGWLLTGVQGWLGSLVVSTNLLPIMVTIHMGLALLIVAMLLYAANRAQQQVSKGNDSYKVKSGPEYVVSDSTSGVLGLLWILLLITFVQIVLGTQVREQIDQVASSAAYTHRGTWVSQLGSVFKVHRSMSVLVTLLNGYAVYLLWPTAGLGLRRLLGTTLGLLGLEIVAGIVLAYFELPAIMQPVHLTLATLLFGAQFLTLVRWQQAKTMAQRAQPQPAHA